jgi:hypothetical protein
VNTILHPGFRRLWARRIKESKVEVSELVERLTQYLLQDQGMEQARVDAVLGDPSHRHYLQQVRPP